MGSALYGADHNALYEMSLHKRIDDQHRHRGKDHNGILDRFGAGVKLVTLEQKLPVDCCHIGFDYAEGVRLAVEHLISKGHQRIAYVGAPIDRYSRNEMLTGYKNAILNNKITLNEKYIWNGICENDTSDLYELENGRMCAFSMTQLDVPPTAYVCINDMTAMGLIHGLQDRGFAVPENVSVIGFDDIPFSSVTRPPLTTVSQNTTKMGSVAFKKLIEHIEKPESTVSSVMLKPELIVRGTA